MKSAARIHRRLVILCGGAAAASGSRSVLHVAAILAGTCGHIEELQSKNNWRAFLRLLRTQYR